MSAGLVAVLAVLGALVLVPAFLAAVATTVFRFVKGLYGAAFAFSKFLIALAIILIIVGLLAAFGS